MRSRLSVSRLYPTTSRRSIRIRIYSWQKVVQTDRFIYDSTPTRTIHRFSAIQFKFNMLVARRLHYRKGRKTSKYIDFEIAIYRLRVANFPLFPQQRHTRIRHPYYKSTADFSLTATPFRSTPSPGFRQPWE